MYGKTPRTQGYSGLLTGIHRCSRSAPALVFSTLLRSAEHAWIADPDISHAGGLWINLFVLDELYVPVHFSINTPTGKVLKLSQFSFFIVLAKP